MQNAAEPGACHRDWLAQLFRRIRYAETAASLFALQRSMIVSFSGMAAEKRRMLDVSTGAACCFLILALGLETIRQSTKWTKE
ncbi:MAG: hypothetical protein HFE80_01780 [Clostridiaceae bacterium]|nr:hypothetical protein [Clostridiaceae bacterium]